MDVRNLPRLVASLMQAARVVAPVQEDGVVLYRPVEQADQVTVAHRLPVNSAKEYLFPPSEDILEFAYEEDGLEVRPVELELQQVLFGLRPCDAAALLRLDEALLSEDFHDRQYEERRRSSAVVTLACDDPAPTCFCSLFGGGPGDTGGSDVMMYPRGDRLLLLPLTDRGRDILSPLSEAEFVSPVDGEEVTRVVTEFEAKRATAPEDLDLDFLDGLDLEALFNHEYWAVSAQRCLSCGTCTFVCPTCHCFYLSDELRGRYGSRIKSWDSCMFPEFTLMAGGHNPRPTKVERGRQRFLHKLAYHRQRHGTFLCTGCGRCVESCPVDYHILDVLRGLKGGA